MHGDRNVYLLPVVRTNERVSTCRMASCAWLADEKNCNKHIRTKKGGSQSSWSVSFILVLLFRRIRILLRAYTSLRKIGIVCHVIIQCLRASAPFSYRSVKKYSKRNLEKSKWKLDDVLHSAHMMKRTRMLLQHIDRRSWMLENHSLIKRDRKCGFLFSGSSKKIDPKET